MVPPSSAASALRKRAGVIALGLATTVVMLVLILARIPLAGVARAMRDAELWPWLPLASGLYLVGHLVRGARCKLLVSGEAQLGVLQGSNVVVLGYAANNLLPLRLGELVRSAMLSRVTGLPFLQSLAVTGAERLLDAGVIFTLLLVSLALSPSLDVSSRAIEITGAGIVAALAALTVIAVLPQAVVRGVSRIARPLPPALGERLLGAAIALTRGVHHLGSPATAAAAFGLSLAVWTIEAGMFLALLPAVGLPADPLVAAFVMAAVNLSILVPSSPGYIGLFHFVATEALVLTGAPEADALVHATLTHLAFYVPVSAWGMGVAAWYSTSLKLADVWARMSAGAEPGTLGLEVLGSVPRAKSPAEPSLYLVGLAEAVIPDLPLGPDVRTEVIRDVARFMRDEFDALPGTLRLALRVGLTGFRALVRLRYGRGFCDLEPARRRAVFDAWAYRGVALNRKLMRPVRSTGLLAFFEHPAVTSHLGTQGGGHVVAWSPFVLEESG